LSLSWGIGDRRCGYLLPNGRRLRAVLIHNQHIGGMPIMTQQPLPSELDVANLIETLKLPTVAEMKSHLAVARDASEVLALGDDFTFKGSHPVEVLDALAAAIDAQETFELLADVCAAGVRAFQETAQRDFAGPESKSPAHNKRGFRRPRLG
jgi:hypothetical protein